MLLPWAMGHLEETVGSGVCGRQYEGLRNVSGLDKATESTVVNNIEIPRGHLGCRDYTGQLVQLKLLGVGIPEAMMAERVNRIV